MSYARVTNDSDVYIFYSTKYEIHFPWKMNRESEYFDTLKDLYLRTLELSKEIRVPKYCIKRMQKELVEEKNGKKRNSSN